MGRGGYGNGINRNTTTRKITITWFHIVALVLITATCFFSSMSITIAIRREQKANGQQYFGSDVYDRSVRNNNIPEPRITDGEERVTERHPRKRSINPRY